MVPQGTGIILRQDCCLADPAVCHVAQRKVNRPVAPADWESRSRPVVGQRAQPAFVVAACQNNTNRLHAHIPLVTDFPLSSFPSG